jgi:hypothetical protein
VATNSLFFKKIKKDGKIKTKKIINFLLDEKIFLSIVSLTKAVFFY